MAADATPATVTSASVSLYGSATCDACPPSETGFGGCPPLHGPLPSGIHIAWTNLTSGQSGAANHAIVGHWAILFSYCWTVYEHAWSAQVPLVPGINQIEIVASGPSAVPGTATLSIVRVPAAPGNVEAIAGQGTIEVRWDAVPEATSYDLYWSDAPVWDLAAATRVEGVSSPFFHALVADDVTYQFAVKALIGAQASTASDVAWATAGWSADELPVPLIGSGEVDLEIATDALGKAYVHLSRSETIGTAELFHGDFFTDASGAWSWLPLPGTAGVDAEIALDSSGVPHASWVGSAGAVHATLAGGAWTTDTHGPWSACDTSLALDALDRVHLAFVVQSPGPTLQRQVRYATNAPGTWVEEVVEPQAQGCTGTRALALAVEPGGRAHLAWWLGAPGYGLAYAVREGGAWTRETIDIGLAQGFSLALEQDGTPRIALCDGGHALRLLRRTSAGSWSSEALPTPPWTSFPALRMGPDGTAHVSYVALTHQPELRYATNAGGIWRVRRINRADAAPTALAIDPQGNVHLGYFRDGRPRRSTNR